MEFGDLSENPFALSARKEKSSRRQALIRAFQIFVVVALATGAVVMLSNQSKRWLAGRLTFDFETLGASAKSERLSQIAELGVFSVEPLVNSMVDKDPSVARTAYELLRKAQNDWSVLPMQEEASRHELLIDALNNIAIKLPDHRTGWGTSLLQQTLLLAAENPHTAAQMLHQRANHAIGLLSLSGRPVDRESQGDLDTTQPRRLEVRADPLPVGSIKSVDEWTTWPPNQETGGMLSSLSEGRGNANQRIDHRGSALAIDREPSVYKSGASRLQPVGKHEIIKLNDISTTPQPQPAQLASVDGQLGASDRADFVSLDATSQVTMVDSPMGTFDDASVMRWLGSPHSVLRDKAKLELVSRGFDGTAIAIATRIQTGDVREKMELIDALNGTGIIDPRPWLLLLLQDESRDVRLHTISILGSMDDPAIARRLQSHLADERDPTVAARIRRVLDLR